MYVYVPVALTVKDPGAHERYGSQQMRRPQANTWDMYAGESTDASTTKEEYIKGGVAKGKSKKSRER